MTNYVQQGDTLNLAAPYDVDSGDGALLGKIFGVATDDALSGETIPFKTEGVFDLAKTSHSFSAGDPVYWDNSNKYCTSTANSNSLIGYAVKAQVSGDATVRVKLSGQPIRRRFVSSEQTGTGSSQNVAHGLGVTPSKVIVTYTDLTPATAGSANVTYGTHTSTNVVVTVTSGKKFIVEAEY